ncbi:MAG: hypothetical protein ACTH6O_17635, partial [Vibrio toranzoniae]
LIHHQALEFPVDETFWAASCSPSDLTGSRDISSDEVVTGPQQSWQPLTHSNAGILSRRYAIISLLLSINIFFSCNARPL